MVPVFSDTEQVDTTSSVEPSGELAVTEEATMETNDAPQISRRQALKKMKIREARKKSRKTKRLGKRSHSKW